MIWCNSATFSTSARSNKRGWDRSQPLFAFDQSIFAVAIDQ